MNLRYLFGSTFRMRCEWVREIERLVQEGEIPPSYQKTVANLSTAYFLPSVAKRHITRAWRGFAPVELLIGITDRCPHDCRYCYYSAGKRGEKKPVDINLDLLDVVLNELRSKYGIRFAVITGGEPFPYVLELAERRPDFII